MKLNFFFDLDGTLLPFGETIKESSVKALKRVQAEGHRIFIASGRSPQEVDPRLLEAVDFDGGVYSAGGTVVLNGEERFRIRLTQEESNFLFDYQEANNLLPLVQTDEGTYLTHEALDFFHQQTMAIMGTTIGIPGMILVDKIPRTVVANKFLLFSPQHTAMRYRTDLTDKFDVVDNTLGISQDDLSEIVLKGVTKATGIEKLLEVLGEGKESTVGVGDGANDLEMVEYCGLGVAMGNASPELKAIADFITDDAKEDGIAKALEYATEVYLKKFQD